MGQIRFKNLDEAEAYLRSHPVAMGSSDLLHCAQSLECQVKGFPEHRHPLFQKSIGWLVSRVFLAMGKMKHDVSAPIPGLREDAELNHGAALARILDSIAAFRAASTIAPHFVYGAVSKSEADALQAHHIADHVTARSR